MKKNQPHTQIGEAGIKSEIRDYSDFIPVVNRSESLKRFFSSTINHLLSSGTTQSVHAYWGNQNFKTSDHDIFHHETDALRDNFQFAPGIVSRENGNVIDIVSYVNFIRRMSQIGADSLNHDKLLSEPGYVLDMPINYDMFVNYDQYYWMPNSVPIIQMNATSQNIRSIITMAISGTTLTIGLSNHGYEDGDNILFSGFSESSMDGLKTSQVNALHNSGNTHDIAVVDDDSFKITGMSGLQEGTQSLSGSSMTVSDGNLVVEKNNHGYAMEDTVTIAGVTDTGFSETQRGEINNTHKITTTASDGNSFTVNIDSIETGNRRNINSLRLEGNKLKIDIWNLLFASVDDKVDIVGFNMEVRDGYDLNDDQQRRNVLTQKQINAINGKHTVSAVNGYEMEFTLSELEEDAARTISKANDVVLSGTRIVTISLNNHGFQAHDRIFIRGVTG